jgi:hypothetical protein
MEWLSKAFRDGRYIRIDKKPLFLVYRARQLPSPRRTAELWRDIASKRGIGDIFLCDVESFASEHCDPREIGFDAAVEFQPDWSNLGQPIAEIETTGHRIYDYADFVERQLRKPEPSYLRFPCVTPSWDNSPRRPLGALTLAHSDPGIYRRWLSHAASGVSTWELQQRIVFINAWNEWAEGNHLEPDLRFQRAYLSATKDALSGPPSRQADADPQDGRRPFPVPEVLEGVSSQPGSVSAGLTELAAFSRRLRQIQQECCQAQAHETRPELPQDLSTVLDHIVRIANDAEQHAKRLCEESSLSDRLISQEQLIHRQQKILGNLRDEIARLEKDLGRVLNSYSWRMTKPLRKILSATEHLVAGIARKY